MITTVYANKYVNSIVALFSIVFLFQNFAFAQNENEADKLYDKGVVLLSKGNNIKALSKLEEAANIYSIVNNTEKETETLHRISLVYAAKLGEWHKAEKWLLKTLNAAIHLPDSDRIASVQANLGVIYEKTGFIAKAEDYHKKALNYYIRKDDELKVMMIQKNIGMLYLNKSNYNLAEKTFESALKTARLLDNNNEIGRLTYNLGLNTYKKGNYSKALSLYKKALVILGDDIMLLDKGEIYNNTGIIYAEYGDTLPALNYYTEALKIAKRIEHRDLESRVLNNIGNLYLSQENYLVAIKFFKLSLDISTETGSMFASAITLNNIGLVYQELKQYNEAEQFFNKSRNIKERIGYVWGNAYQNYCYGNLYIDKKEYQKAQFALIKAIMVADSLQLADLQYKIYASFGRLYAEEGDTIAAIKNYNQSIDVIEDMRTLIAYEHNRSDFMETVIPIYKSMIEIQLLRGNIETAFNYYERMKARNLLEIVNGADVVFENNISPDEYIAQTDIIAKQKQNTHDLNVYCESEEYKSRDLDDILSAQRSLIERYIDFRTNLYLRYPDIKTKFESGAPVNCETAAMSLNPRTQASVAYMVTEKQTYCFVLKRPTEIDYEVNLVTLPVTENDLKEYTGTTIKDFEVQNQELLYLLLVKPIVPYLQGISEVCLIPDIYLYSVPFQSLKNPNTNKYLIEDYAVSYNYSLSLFMSLKDIEHKTEQNILAFGNPNFDNHEYANLNKEFEALPKSEEEVLAIKNLFDNNSHVFLHEQASEANFKHKANNYSILHFATHGIFDNVNPMYSSLILSADSIEDGVVTAGEIFQMDLKSALVVLSACETAKGVIDYGEGILGLSRAFIGAKVPTIVATQWQVDDRSTKLLMEEFYKNVKKSGNYTIAMQKAQLHLLKNTKYNNAYFWAPFIVLGASE